MTPDDVRRFREDHAADLCVCGSPRSEHYGPDGATLRRQTPGPRCSASSLATPTPKVA